MWNGPIELLCGLRLCISTNIHSCSYYSILSAPEQKLCFDTLLFYAYCKSDFRCHLILLSFNFGLLWFLGLYQDYYLMTLCPNNDVLQYMSKHVLN